MVDFDSLLQPISADNPSGNNIRLDPSDATFTQLEVMRQDVDPTTDPGGETRSADWKGVVRLASEALTTRSKDLELASFLTQAMVETEGFSGLLTGLRLQRSLVGEFWPTLHPGWDEGEIIEPIRARPLSWLGSSKDFLRSVKNIPLSAPIGDEAFSWFDYEQSQRVDQAARQSDQGPLKELLASGFIPGEKWRSSLSGTPPERLQGVLTAIAECLAELQNLDQACEEKFQEDMPFFLDLRNLLEEIKEYLEQAQAGSVDAMADDAAPGEGFAEGAAGQPGAAAATAGAAAVAAPPPGPISSRDEAYRRLREAAEYLRKTEPHSPVPMLLDRAVRWGNMNFENLFDDFVKNKEARSQTRDLLGLEED
jgi:type VI secretion system protein ImpA